MNVVPGPLGRVAAGLGLVVVALNLFWLEATLRVLCFALHDELAQPGLAETLLIVSVVPPCVFLAGECYCLAAPGRRSALFIAVPLTALAMALATSTDTPSWHRLLRGLPVLSAESANPERHWLRLLAALLTGSAQAAFVYFVYQLARSIDSERLAARALVLFKGTLVLFGVACAILFGANEAGLLIGTLAMLLAGLVWMSLYCWLLLHVREAVLHAAGRAEGGHRG